jgi:hypothetical protein
VALAGGEPKGVVSDDTREAVHERDRRVVHSPPPRSWVAKIRYSVEFVVEACVSEIP